MRNISKQVISRGLSGGDEWRNTQPLHSAHRNALTIRPEDVAH